MITDLLEQMSRKQLESTARELNIPVYLYSTKAKLVAAIRKKREKLS